MKRDMSVLRRILLEMESWPNQRTSRLRMVRLEGVEDAVTAGHVEMLDEAGYIETIDVDTMGSPYRQLSPTRITNRGHDFLAAIKHDGVFAKLQAKASEQGTSFPLELIKELGTSYLKKLTGLD